MIYYLIFLTIGLWTIFGPGLATIYIKSYNLGNPNNNNIKSTIVILLLGGPMIMVSYCVIQIYNIFNE